MGGVSPEEFRNALRPYATGVTVVTAIGPQGPSGATANAVTSLSLDPPIMLACLDRGSRTLTSVREQGRFSAKDPGPEKWQGVGWAESEQLPRLDGALVWVACELRDLIDGGDHLILTGNVLEAESREGQPLLFHRGAYRDLLAEA